MKRDDGKRFTITAAATGDLPLYTLAELDAMADEVVATAEEVGAPPKTIGELDHAKIWAGWNAPKVGARS